MTLEYRLLIILSCCSFLASGSIYITLHISQSISMKLMDSINRNFFFFSAILFPFFKGNLFALAVIDTLSKVLSTGIFASQHVKSFITWLFILAGLQSWIYKEMKCRMQCNTTDSCSSFSSRHSHKNWWLIKVLVWISRNSFQVFIYCLD